MKEPRVLQIPDPSLVVLIGASCSGKSSFARQHFKATETLSSDAFRAMIGDDENNMDATQDAFDALHYVAAKRLAARRLTVIDATNLKSEDRKPLTQLAREYHLFPVAVILDMPEKVCQERNRNRTDRQLPRGVINQHIRRIHRRFTGSVKGDGFRYVYRLRGEEEVNNVQINRQPLWTDRRGDAGPFDIIGDIHGCCGELEALLETLGYARNERGVYAHPEGRRAIFLGDLTDRGPRNLDVLRIAMGMHEEGNALCVPGNHDVKLLRKLQGRNVQITHGLEKTLAELEALPEAERAAFEEKTAAFIDGMVSHYLLDGGKLVAAHAGMPEHMQGRASSPARDFALYGETTGETDSYGLPERLDWAVDYKGRAAVVYGHTAVTRAEWVNGTINIDTGCVFGGALTALRYPEKTLVSIPAEKQYSVPAKPLEADDGGGAALLLNIADYQRKMLIHTRLMGNVIVNEENAAAALEVMTRFTAAPEWLVYLPPTMSPCEVSAQPDMLERPEEAFAYFEKEGVEQVVCEEKYMGSRAVAVICQNEQAAERRFGVESPAGGACYTRTGRPFFSDEAEEEAVIRRLRAAFDAADFWNAHETDWACIDAEIMPWSAKAQELVKGQYASAGAAGEASLSLAGEALRRAEARGIDISYLRERAEQRAEGVQRYREAYRRYCWEVGSIDDLRIAPFHLLAAEGRSFLDKNHLWHLNALRRLADADPGWLIPAEHKTVRLSDEAQRQEAIEWWERLTGEGGEGAVVKPLDFIAHNPRNRLIQPALKCRGREYLRIIYGPEYLLPDRLQRLKQRSLNAKRMLALREFALGAEALERRARREPISRAHECVFAILALESEPVDPRL